MPLADYLSEKIWQPMGAEADASWMIDKGGYEVGVLLASTPRCATTRGSACCSRTTARSTAGRSSPPHWVRAATTPPAKQFEPGQTGALFGYGYQTWILAGRDRQFVLRGLRGQAIFVDPKSKLVMVHTAAGNVGTPSTGELLSLWSGCAAQPRGCTASPICAVRG